MDYKLIIGYNFSSMKLISVFVMVSSISALLPDCSGFQDVEEGSSTTSAVAVATLSPVKRKRGSVSPMRRKFAALQISSPQSAEFLLPTPPCSSRNKRQRALLETKLMPPKKKKSAQAPKTPPRSPIKAKKRRLAMTDRVIPKKSKPSKGNQSHR